MKHYFLLVIILLLLVVTACKTKVKQAQSKFANQPLVPLTYIEKLDSLLNEDSGIIYWKNMLWSFNDSGGKNQVYGCDARTGKIIITLQLNNVCNTDWEDIAQDENYIYIGETGNNFGSRLDLQIFMLNKKEISSAPYQEVDVSRINFRYADQTIFGQGLKMHNFDCEALFAFNDSLYLFTKNWVDYKTKAYVMPAIEGDYILTPIDSFNVQGLITGADINENGEFALIGYQDYKSFAWTFQKTKNRLFDHATYIDLTMLVNAQTEGICFDHKNDLLFSCEQTDSFPQKVWEIPFAKY